ncbi:MAG: hypothetical protein AWM53_00615 [Candidatus Dichloromethanomonas elyunquensis]|nr:MAG: hypothetical protein AWM53_00615 [Candidatus Dichloromethanomonas elyunquensis]
MFRLKSGELRINHVAVKDIVKQSASGIDGLRKSGSLIRTKEDGIEISVLCQLDEGVGPSLISEKIRDTVTRDIEQYSGIRVKEVKVLLSPQRWDFTAKKK